MSAAARKRIAEAKRQWWAQRRGTAAKSAAPAKAKKTAPKSGRRISAAGRKRIAAAARKMWAERRNKAKTA